SNTDRPSRQCSHYGVVVGDEPAVYDEYPEILSYLADNIGHQSGNHLDYIRPDARLWRLNILQSHRIDQEIAMHCKQPQFIAPPDQSRFCRYDPVRLCIFSDKVNGDLP